MHRFDGTAARQLDLIIDRVDGRDELPGSRPARRAAPPAMKLLRQDIYAELARRRRRAQIAARRWTNDR